MVTYTFTNGTDADADEVNQNFIDVEGNEYADNTGGNVFNSSSETDLATITVLQNDLNSNASLFITAGLRMTDDVNTTFRLYVNGSVVKTIIGYGGSGLGTIKGAGTFTYLATGLDSTAGDIIVKVTGQPSSTSPGAGGYCDGLIVRGYNK